jgi:hypothetical protein
LKATIYQSNKKPTNSTELNICHGHGAVAVAAVQMFYFNIFFGFLSDI